MYGRVVKFLIGVERSETSALSEGDVLGGIVDAGKGAALDATAGGTTGAGVAPLAGNGRDLNM